jgi:steroid 5-alpha reductase family enzyme
LQIAATAFVVAWAVRLGGFLVVRVWKTGHDSRFDEAKHQPFKFWIYWTMQVCALVLGAGCSLPKFA